MNTFYYFIIFTDLALKLLMLDLLILRTNRIIYIFQRDGAKIASHESTRCSTQCSTRILMTESIITMQDLSKYS